LTWVCPGFVVALLFILEVEILFDTEDCDTLEPIPGGKFEGVGGGGGELLEF
jgi:hypothetical protein